MRREELSGLCDVRVERVRFGMCCHADNCSGAYLFDCEVYGEKIGVCVEDVSCCRAHGPCDGYGHLALDAL